MGSKYAERQYVFGSFSSSATSAASNAASARLENAYKLDNYQSEMCASYAVFFNNNENSNIISQASHSTTPGVLVESVVISWPATMQEPARVMAALSVHLSVTHEYLRN